MNFAQIQKQAQLINALKKKIEDFEKQEFTYEYRSLVTVVIKGDCTIVNIKVNRDLVDPDDVETLEEMLANALNYAIHEVNTAKEKILPKY